MNSLGITSESQLNQMGLLRLDTVQSTIRLIAAPRNRGSWSRGVQSCKTLVQIDFTRRRSDLPERSIDLQYFILSYDFADFCRLFQMIFQCFWKVFFLSELNDVECLVRVYFHSLRSISWQSSTRRTWKLWKLTVPRAAGSLLLFKDEWNVNHRRDLLSTVQVAKAGSTEVWSLLLQLSTVISHRPRNFAPDLAEPWKV